MTTRRRWLDIDSPSQYALWWGQTLAAIRDGTPPPPPLPTRPWWHHALVHVPALLVDRVRNRVVAALDVFHILMAQAGFTRVDNLDPTQIRDE